MGASNPPPPTELLKKKSELKKKEIYQILITKITFIFKCGAIYVSI
jgi:hypothetical protein